MAMEQGSADRAAHACLARGSAPQRLAHRAGRVSTTGGIGPWQESSSVSISGSTEEGEQPWPPVVLRAKNTFLHVEDVIEPLRRSRSESDVGSVSSGSAWTRQSTMSCDGGALADSSALFGSPFVPPGSQSQQPFAEDGDHTPGRFKRGGFHATHGGAGSSNDRAARNASAFAPEAPVSDEAEHAFSESPDAEEPYERTRGNQQKGRCKRCPHCQTQGGRRNGTDCPCCHVGHERKQGAQSDVGHERAQRAPPGVDNQRRQRVRPDKATRERLKQFAEMCVAECSGNPEQIAADMRKRIEELGVDQAEQTYLYKILSLSDVKDEDSNSEAS